MMFLRHEMHQHRLRFRLRLCSKPCWGSILDLCGSNDAVQCPVNWGSGYPSPFLFFFSTHAAYRYVLRFLKNISVLVYDQFWQPC